MQRQGSPTEKTSLHTQGYKRAAAPPGQACPQTLSGSHSVYTGDTASEQEQFMEHMLCPFPSNSFQGMMSCHYELLHIFIHKKSQAREM